VRADDHHRRRDRLPRRTGLQRPAARLPHPAPRRRRAPRPHQPRRPHLRLGDGRRGGAAPGARGGGGAARLHHPGDGGRRHVVPAGGAAASPGRAAQSAADGEGRARAPRAARRLPPPPLPGADGLRGADRRGHRRESVLPKAESRQAAPEDALAARRGAAPPRASRGSHRRRRAAFDLQRRRQRQPPLVHRGERAHRGHRRLRVPVRPPLRLLPRHLLPEGGRFALQVVRQPLPDVVTCLGGGYIASGEAGADRLPLPGCRRGSRSCRWRAPGRCRRR